MATQPLPRVDPELSFDSFVRTHTRSLLRTAYLLTGNSLAAEELVQDTFVRLYPKWDRVATADQPIAYVRRALTNAFLSNQRSRAAHDIVTDQVPERVAHRDLEVIVSDRELVWQLLGTLPQRQRAVLVMRFFEDLPDDDIAAALHCRLGTVRSLASRGLAALRVGLAQFDEAGGRS